MARKPKDGALSLTGLDLRRLAHKHELRFNPDGTIRLTNAQILKMVSSMTKRDIQRLADAISREKWGKTLARVHQESIVDTMRGIAEVTQQYDPDAHKKARYFVPLTPAFSSAREFGASRRQINRWMNRADRPSRGMRKHIRNRKAAQRRK